MWDDCSTGDESFSGKKSSDTFQSHFAGLSPFTMHVSGIP